MRASVILGTSSSSIATPSNSSHHHYHQSKPFKPQLSKFFPSKPTSPPPSTFSAAHSRSTLFSSIRLDPNETQLLYFADLASKLARDGKLEDFAMVVESVVLSGMEGSHFASKLSVEHLVKGILGCLRNGKVENVLEMVRKLDQLGVPLLKLSGGNAMELLRGECLQILKSGEVEELVELLEILSGFGFSINALLKPSDVIRICIDKRKPKMAVRYACILPHAHILFCDIIREFGKKKDLACALSVYEVSKQNLSSANMYLYRTIIDVCGRCDDFQKSRYIYEEMLNQKINPNIYVLNSLMNVNAHDLNYAFHVYKNMQNMGIRADMASYNILLKACCLSGRVDMAQDIYREVQHLESSGELKLDVFTYSTIIKVLADAKLCQMALKVKEDMQAAGVTPNTVTWSSLISACANAGQVEKTIQLFEEMVLVGCEPNSQCYNILLHACVEACQYDRAFRLFQSWKENIVQDTCRKEDRENKNSNSIMEKVHRESVTSVSSSISSIQHLKFKGLPFTPNTTTYNTLMKACGSDYQRAKALMDEMRKVGLLPNQITWSILIDIYGGSGDLEGALQILKTMRAADVEPDVITYTTIIKVCVESKSLKLAFSLYDEMKRYQIQPNLVTYNTLLRARNRYGSLLEVQQCLVVYQDMRKAGYKSNDYYLKLLIEEWCEGVIQDNNQNQDEACCCNKTDTGTSHSLLLERVAENLQKHIAESPAIDLQGLTMVEARIVVLAVLQMVKENYNKGNSVESDILVILGVSKIGADPDKQILEVKDAITKLLQDDLGLEVLTTKPNIALNKTIELENLTDSRPKPGVELRRNELCTGLQYSTRRPGVVQKLKITRESLQHWLQKRCGIWR